MSRIVLPIRCSFEQHPARLVDEGRILVAASGGWTKIGVVVDLDHAVPGDELGRLAPAVLEIDADGLGIRLAQAEDQVGQLARCGS